MTAKAKKGASQLHLNNKELRRELYRADVIILTALSLMHSHEQEQLKHQLTSCQTTTTSDPLAEDARLEAMHRIKPKCDYNKMMLIILALILALAWYSAQTDIQFLQAQLVQVDYR